MTSKVLILRNILAAQFIIKKGSKKSSQNDRKQSQHEHVSGRPHTHLPNKLRLNAKEIVDRSLKKNTIITIEDASDEVEDQSATMEECISNVLSTIERVLQEFP